MGTVIKRSTLQEFPCVFSNLPLFTMAVHYAECFFKLYLNPIQMCVRLLSVFGPFFVIS